MNGMLPAETSCLGAPQGKIRTARKMMGRAPGDNQTLINEQVYI